MTAIAREHLTKAIARYREALEIAPSNRIAKLGLGWTLIQAGDAAEAISTLRELVAQSQAADQATQALCMDSVRSQKKRFATWFLCSIQCETGPRSIACAQAEKDLSLILRPVTPIAVPLADGISAQDIVDPHASLAFDLDGSALPQRWTWIWPTAAWLVFDKHGSGSITSGLQLFGSVTFWMFWRQGYDALRALDDDDDGQIAATELKGLALWHDRNANGRSDTG